MVIEQVDRAVWVNHGSSAKIAEEMRLEKVREKLSERQEMVLSFVEKRRKFDGIFTTSNDLILHLKILVDWLHQNGCL